MFVLPFLGTFWLPWFAIIRNNHKLCVTLAPPRGQPLFLTSYLDDIFEFRNFDNSVKKIDAGAVVVLKHAGKLRFKYTGPDSEFTSEKSFEPIGITTGTTKRDSNHRLWEPAINIVDQDRQFLYNIDNCDIRNPYGMFVDVRDNLHVTKFDEFNVKKIKYFISIRTIIVEIKCQWTHT